MKKFLSLVLCAALCVGIFGAAIADNTEAAQKAATMTLDELAAAAQAEGSLNSLGMPDEWANWKALWDYITDTYGIAHADTDMSSAEELAKFENEKDNATGDIGDIGLAMTSVAMEKDLLLPFKTTYWDSIPDWAKEEDGKWIEAYTCTIAFMVDKDNLKGRPVPTTWAELKEGGFNVCIGDVLKASQAYHGVLSAAVALGGDEGNLQPAIEYFAEIAQAGLLNVNNPMVANLEKGEADVAVVWDFNALGYRDQIDTDRFEVVIPSDGAVQSGYASVINKYAKNPYAAMLSREIMLSDIGQNFLAEGYARPIRGDIELTEEALAKQLPADMYANTYKINDFQVWETTVADLSDLWQEEVAIYIQ
ncbi:MAG: ABC transporter substrate-binding protein [Clostridia bacterium]|nr:ABC transporter substrate-binding protein [Clostridia bacterium]